MDTLTGEFARARSRMAATCLLELHSAEDPFLRCAAAEGMGSALLVPIIDGSDTIATIALFSRAAAPPSAELMVSLDAIALQLGAMAHICRPELLPPVGGGAGLRVGVSVFVASRRATGGAGTAGSAGRDCPEASHHRD